MLVSDQHFEGNWSGGQYPGSSPTLDTCLALLFLKRANLAKDLTEKLPFKPADLNHDIMDTLTPSKPSSVQDKPSPTSEPDKKPIPSVEPPKQPTEQTLLTKSLPSRSDNATQEEDGVGKKKWIVIGLLVLAIFAGSGSLIILLIVKRNRNEHEKKNRTAKKRKNKRVLHSKS